MKSKAQINNSKNTENKAQSSTSANQTNKKALTLQKKRKVTHKQKTHAQTTATKQNTDTQTQTNENKHINQQQQEHRKRGTRQYQRNLHKKVADTTKKDQQVTRKRSAHIQTATKQ